MTARPRRRLTRRERLARERFSRGLETAGSSPGGEDAATGPARANRRRVPARTALVALGLAALVFASYFPALSAGFVWDDTVFTEEPVLREGVAGLAKIWFSPRAISNEGHYWPLVYSSFWLEHKLWGLAPLGYHLVNLLLHLLCTVLVWRLLARLPAPGAALAAAVFAVHPLHVESVVWVIERKDLLSALFYLGSVLCWLRFVERPRPAPYLNSLLLLAAALLSKSIAVTLPAALLIERFWKTGRIVRQDLLRTAPFFVVAFGISLADVAYYRTREILSLDYSLVERALIAGRALWFYAGKLVWPGELPVIYPLWEIRATDLAGWAWVAGAAVLAAGAWAMRERWGRGPLAGLLFFAVTLSPVLGFVDYGYMQFSLVADRFQYLAGIGLIALLIGAAVTWTSRLPEPGRKGAAAAFCLIVTLFSVQSFRQSRIYRDPVTFFQHIASLNPDARNVDLNLADALAEQDRYEEALVAARRAVETSVDPASAYSNLGLAYLSLGRFEEAEAALREARSLGPTHRNAGQNLAELFRRMGQPDAAIPLYREVLERDPEFALAYAGLGDVLFQAGEHEAAVTALRRALSLDPGMDIADSVRYVLGQTLSQLERYDEAAEVYERLAAADPANPEPLANLANVLSAQGRAEEASAYLQRIRELGSSNAMTLQLAAEALRKQGRYEEAVEGYRRVLEVDPDFGSAHAGLASALFELGRYGEAIDSMEEALAIEPVESVVPARETLIGRALLELGRPEEAAERFLRALATDPVHPSAIDNLAMLRFGQRRYEEARDLYRTHLGIDPDNPHIHSNLGASLYYLGEPEAALRSFERALALDPANEAAQQNLRRIRAELAPEREPG